MPAPPLLRALTANISQLTHTKLTQLGLWPSVAKFYVQCTSFVLQVQRFDEFLINDLTSFLINDFTRYFDQRFDEFSINDFAKFLSTTVGTVQSLAQCKFVPWKIVWNSYFSRSSSKFFEQQQFDEFFTSTIWRDFWSTISRIFDQCVHSASFALQVLLKNYLTSTVFRGQVLSAWVIP